MILASKLKQSLLDTRVKQKSLYPGHQPALGYRNFTFTPSFSLSFSGATAFMDPVFHSASLQQPYPDLPCG